MQIRILCIGKIKDTWISAGIAEFEKRIKPYAALTVTELPEVRIPVRAAPAEIAAVKEKEGELLLSAAHTGDILIALDPQGKPESGESFAARIGDARISGRNLAFIIGGPLGLSPSLLSSVHQTVSLSRLTFTHTMCRLILIEQIYRALKILAGEPYQK